ncbi:MAG: aminotransferase class IV [Ferruginibacter sp.]
MRYINYNETILNESVPIIGASNRGLRYGDGLFETISYKKGQFVLIEAHLNRLWHGMEMMQFELPKLFNRSFVIEQLKILVAKNNDHTARVRLMVFRSDGGLYDLENKRPNFVIQSWPLLTATNELNSNGLELCIFEDARKICDAFANIKHNNYLPYLMGALHAKKHQFNDAVILNQEGHVCDSTNANIFIIKNNCIFTPALHQGCVSGIMRDFLLKALQLMLYEVIETSISVEMLLNADEVFLSNAIYNIRWVKSVENSQYGVAQTQKIFYQLTKTNPNIFC